MNFKNLSGNELSEMLGLFASMDHSMRRGYVHLWRHMPKSFIKSFDKTYKALCDEEERREAALNRFMDAEEERIKRGKVMTRMEVDHGT